MKVKSILCAAALVSETAMAGGILTNTNQHVTFLRNPARDAAIGLDAVYSNPAGVVYLDEGLHLSINWQSAFQTRTVTTTNPFFQYGIKNNGNAQKEFEGKAKAPVVPSFQVAYNKGRWSFQGSFAVTGGGGKCEFANGLGSFEGYVGGIGTLLGGVSQQLGAAGVPVPAVTGYDVDGYMQGRQYYFGVTVGAAYKINEHWSVYGGARVLYGDATYKAKLENIRVMTADGGLSLPQYFNSIENGLNAASSQIQQGVGQYVGAYMAAGMTQEQAMATPEVQALLAKGQTLKATGESLMAQADMLAPYAKGVNLQSDQTGWGIAPIVGVDYKLDRLNVGLKYEFKTRMRMLNKSTVEEASIIDAVNKFRDGTKVPEDSPALLSVGAQYELVDGVRVSAGYHRFFDKDSHQYMHQERLLDNDSQEYLAGIEWDVTDRLTVSGGAQCTRYGLTDEYMNDMSFVVNSWSFGLGASYKISDRVSVEAAYFQTNYSDYNRTTPAHDISMGSVSLSMPEIHDCFSRTNRVFGAGVTLSF